MCLINGSPLLLETQLDFLASLLQPLGSGRLRDSLATSDQDQTEPLTLTRCVSYLGLPVVWDELVAPGTTWFVHQ